MNDTLEFLVRHGTTVLFAVVFIEQMGVPLPDAPWLLAAGTLSAGGKMNWWMALAAATFSSLLADMIWFYFDRFCGHRVLNLLRCISLEPDSCVRRTQDIFTRNGMRGVVATKFIPGLSTLASPMAGSSGVSTPRFLILDGLGSSLYGGCFILVGAIFSCQLEQVINALAGLGGGALAVVGGLAALYIGYKFWQRQRLLNELRMARITVDELHQKQEAGENPLVLDLRSAINLIKTLR
jgi:membrane protein DedA with SNARE-associated domain